MKFLLTFFCFFSCFTLFAEQLPTLIDFNREQPTWDMTPYKRTLSDPEHQAFNYATEIGAFIEYLMDIFSIDTLVETGTYEGRTTAFFSMLGKQVHTIEVVQEIYEKTKDSLKDRSNITCYLGSSEKVLKDLLPSLQSKPLLFYLDAHWYDNWPLLHELEEISKTHYDNCIIVIDDFKVPGRKDIPYDKYKKQECSIDYIYSHLQKLFSEYTIHFVIPKNLKCRAKFVAYPKKWVSITTHQSN